MNVKDSTICRSLRDCTYANIGGRIALNYLVRQSCKGSAHSTFDRLSFILGSRVLFFTGRGLSVVLVSL